jgi:predicted  nucleic acid-binding Zn-ribbon protein
MKKSQALIFGVLICGGAAFLWVQHENQARSQQENRALRDEIVQLQTQNQQLQSQSTAQPASGAPATDAERELLKLRGEVGQLRRELAEAAAQNNRRTAQQITEQQRSEQQRSEQESAAQAERSKELAIAKLNYTRGWLLTFMAYAQQHGGQLPANFESATPYGSEFVTKDVRLAPDQFDIMLTGSLNDLANANSVIMLREKQASQAADGTWTRAYGFGDGHSEIHKAVDGNFEPWEAQHRPSPDPQPGQ